jgi:hypothetical protein
MRVSHSEMVLSSARSDLEKAWNASGIAWNDEARTKFEKDFMEPFLVASRTSIGAMTELSNLLKRVVRQCS